MASDAFVACRGTRWLVRSLYFPVFLQIRNLPSRSHDLKHTHTSILPAAHSCARVLQLCFTHPKSRGGRSAEKRSGACEAPVGRALGASQDARVNALMTRHARRLRGALRPITRDARLSALHRGVSPLRSFPRKRESRSWVPAFAGTNGRGLRHSPLRLQDRLPETPLNERGCSLLAQPRYVVNSVVGM
jgi:hypothetical protein